MHYLDDVKHLLYSVANILRTISTKFYDNRAGFVDDVTKTFGMSFEFAVYCCSLTKRER